MTCDYFWRAPGTIKLIRTSAAFMISFKKKQPNCIFCAFCVWAPAYSHVYNHSTIVKELLDDAECTKVQVRKYYTKEHNMGWPLYDEFHFLNLWFFSTCTWCDLSNWQLSGDEVRRTEKLLSFIGGTQGCQCHICT